MKQEQGLVGKFVGNMIRRSVRRRFRNVYWRPPTYQLRAPVIFVPNHHGWFDGYLMFLAVSRLRITTLDWIQEFDSFPLFSKVGGMPYPLANPRRRAATVKRTIRLMRERNWSLLLFAEAQLHYPPELLPFGKALGTIAQKVPEVQVIPVSIKYEFALHERPEAFIHFGEPIPVTDDLESHTRQAVETNLFMLEQDIRSGAQFEVLFAGTPDVNERWDMRRFHTKRTR